MAARKALSAAISPRSARLQQRRVQEAAQFACVPPSDSADGNAITDIGSGAIQRKLELFKLEAERYHIFMLSHCCPTIYRK
eukprot:SAG31_NODE_16447_length_709_cov_0.844262_1_plen_81_part_00